MGSGKTWKIWKRQGIRFEGRKGWKNQGIKCEVKENMDNLENSGIYLWLCAFLYSCQFVVIVVVVVMLAQLVL